MKISSSQFSPRTSVRQPNACRFGNSENLPIPPGFITNGVPPKGTFDIYISYHPANFDQAEQVAKILKSLGRSALMRAPDTSQNPSSSLPWLLENANTLLALLSPQAVADPDIQAEHNQFLSKGVLTHAPSLLPLYIEDCQPSIFIQSLGSFDWSQGQRVFTNGMERFYAPEQRRPASRPPFPGKTPRSEEEAAGTSWGGSIPELEALKRRHGLD